MRQNGGREKITPGHEGTGPEMFLEFCFLVTHVKPHHPTLVARRSKSVLRQGHHTAEAMEEVFSHSQRKWDCSWTERNREGSGGYVYRLGVYELEAERVSGVRHRDWIKVLASLEKLLCHRTSEQGRGLNGKLG